MPRANRLRGGGVFHLTHRCHNRAFLLKFARARDAYRAKLREHLQRLELKMVRCGMVGHPREWVGYHEIMGSRRRYRLLDLDQSMQETTLRYGRESGPKSGRKALN